MESQSANCASDAIISTADQKLALERKNRLSMLECSRRWEKKKESAKKPNLKERSVIKKLRSPSFLLLMRKSRNLLTIPATSTTAASKTPITPQKKPSRRNQDRTKPSAWTRVKCSAAWMRAAFSLMLMSDILFHLLHLLIYNEVKQTLSRYSSWYQDWAGPQDPLICFPA